MKPGLYKNGKMIYTWEQLLDEKNIELSNKNKHSLYYFNNLSSDADLVLPENIEIIEYDAIAGEPLNCLYISKNIKKIEMESCGIGTIRNIEVDPENQNFSSLDGVLFNKDQTILIRYPSEKDEERYVIPREVKTIGYNAFANNTFLKEIIFSDTIQTISSYSFSGCEELDTIKLNKGLKNINDSAFYECAALKKIYIPSTVENLHKDIFDYTVNLEEVIVDSENKFYDSRDNCNAIIKTKENLLMIGTKNTIISEGIEIIGADSLYPKIGEITIPSSIKKVETNAFYASDITNVIYQGNEENFKKIDGYKNILEELHIDIDEINFQKTLEDLIMEGYSFINANKIIKTYEKNKIR